MTTWKRIGMIVLETSAKGLEVPIAAWQSVAMQQGQNLQ